MKHLLNNRMRLCHGSSCDRVSEVDPTTRSPLRTAAWVTHACGAAAAEQASNFRLRSGPNIFSGSSTCVFQRIDCHIQACVPDKSIMTFGPEVFGLAISSGSPTCISERHGLYTIRPASQTRASRRVAPRSSDFAPGPNMRLRKPGLSHSGLHPRRQHHGAWPRLCRNLRTGRNNLRGTSVRLRQQGLSYAGLRSLRGPGAARLTGSLHVH